MGIGGWLRDRANDVGETVEGAIDDGAELLGEGVEQVSHVAEDGLDAIGAESAADWVREHGDQLADQLGADVGEMQLGETEDPKQLIHGDTGKIDEDVSHLDDLAKAFGNVSAGMSSIDTGNWQGQAGDAYDARWSKTPADWARAQAACEKASGALKSFSSTVTWAQDQAAEAIRQWKEAETKQQAALDAHNAKVSDYNAAVDRYNATAAAGGDPGTKPTAPGEFVDPGPALFEAAQQTLKEARRQRNEAGDQAASTISSAAATAPESPDFVGRMSANATDLAAWGQTQKMHFTGGALKGLAGMARFARSINPTDPYNLLHPAEYTETVSNTAAGLVYATAHPGELASALVGSGWTTDPAEAAGRLAPDAIITALTAGGGAAAKGAGALDDLARLGDDASRFADDAARIGDDAADTARRGVPDECKNVCGDPVDVATGAVFLEQTDLHLPGVLPLVVTRKHSSDWTYGLWFGRTWASTFDERIDLDDDGEHVVVVRADATAQVFPKPTPEEPTEPVAGGRTQLSVTEVGGYTLTDLATGQQRHYLAPVQGRSILAALTDPTGHRYTIARDPYGAPVEIRHTGGYRILIDTQGSRITALTVVRDDGTQQGAEPVKVAEYVYGLGDTDAGHLVGVINASGHPLRFAYDDIGRLVEWADRNDTVYTYRYDDAGRCVDQAGTDGVMANTFAYTVISPTLRETVVTDSAGHSTRFLINERSQVLSVTDALGGETRSVWDERNRLQSRTDPLGRTTSFSYDADGTLVALTRPDGLQQTVAYTDAGGRPQPTRTVLPDGTDWVFEYDENGNRTAATDPLGATTTFTFDQRGHLAAVSDALGNVRTIETDPAGLPLVITEADGNTTRLERDAFGRVTTITDALGATVTLTWTPDSQLASRTLPDGTTETWTYDGEGNPVEHTDPAGRITRTEFTHFDLPAAVTAPDGSVTRYQYDPELRLRQVTNPQGGTWSYDYDPAGRLVAETDYNGRTLRYDYDRAGQLTRRINGADEVVAYERDLLGNIATQRVGETATVMTYDPLGRLLRATGPEVELVLQRDPLGRITAETINGRTVTSTYDKLGRRLARTTPAGVQTTWTYGSAPQPTGVTVNGHLLGIDRDLLGREIRRDLGGATLDQTWNQLGQLTGQTLTSTPPAAAAGNSLADRLGGLGGSVPAPSAGAEPRVLQQRGYTYATGGDLVGIDDQLTGARRFELDIANRITSVTGSGWTEAYAYDPMGNITRSLTNGAADSERREYDGTLLTRSGRNRYRYDEQGRLVGRTKIRLSRRPETWTYEWDGDDRMTGVRTPDGTHWRYHYDILGRRVAKRRLTESGDVGEEILFAWDGTTLIEETTSTGSRSWTHDGLHPVAQLNLSDDEVDTRFYAIITDLVGTPTELITPEGDLAWHTKRTLWGAPSDPADSLTPLRFPGQYVDAETGLYYNVHRYYDASTARYIAQDRLGLAPAPNPSNYVHNPTRWTDPLGLMGCLEGKTDHQVMDPTNPERTITDIDRIENGVLWEEKSATKAMDPDKWIDKHVNGKFERYMEARQHMPGYDNAPIGFDFTSPGMDPGFRAGVESAIEALRQANPGVDIRVRFA
ncbi:putative T7SS-secreted protein [Nocardioides sp. NPDC000445]|uniref:putative T7SS-secreted protein n=1 Tax=Nocardioides sp. NPDC000445 TaxID=3154257 RepID=UPI00331CBED7